MLVDSNHGIYRNNADFRSWPAASDIVAQPNVGLSNRPFGVKRFQTIGHHGC